MLMLGSGIISGILGLIGLVLLLYCLIDIISSERSGLAKVLWILVMLCFPVAGCIVYLIIDKA